jgi:hypothetical protein
MVSLPHSLCNFHQNQQHNNYINHGTTNNNNNNTNITTTISVLGGKMRVWVFDGGMYAGVQKLFGDMHVAHRLPLLLVGIASWRAMDEEQQALLDTEVVHEQDISVHYHLSPKHSSRLNLDPFCAGGVHLSCSLIFLTSD